MEQEKMKKFGGVIGGIIGIIIFVFYVYNSYNTNQLNKFVNAYNDLVKTSQVAFIGFETKFGEDGKLKNPSEFDTFISKMEDLAKNKCNLLKVEEVKKDCIEVFSKYVNLFNDLKTNGASEETGKGIEEVSMRLIKLENDLTTKVGIKFQ